MSNLYNLLKRIIEKLNATVKSVNELPQSDWNQNDETAHDYVKNRPFYTSAPVETVLVEESTVTFADTGYGFYAAEFPSTFEGTVGETYKVYWDGAAYECTCVKFNNGQAIGNLSVAGAGSDTSEPFLIGIVNDGRIEIATQNTSSSHTFSISAKVAQVVKIDKKYLVQPDLNQNDETAPDYVKNRPFYTGDPVETVLVEESTVSFTDTGSGFYMGELQSTIEATVGETYKVSWDGATYECVCADFNNMPAIGNSSIAGAGSDTGEPFLIVIVNGQGIQIATADTSASHTFSISGIVAQIVKIDDKYLAISETIDLSSLSEWTGEQKQNLYDKFKSGKVLLAKNIPDVEGLLTITYVNYDNMFSKFEINAIGDNYACKSYGSSWDIFELSDTNVQNRINNTLRDKTSWNLYSARASDVDIGEPFSIQLQCIEGKPVFYFQLKGNPGVDIRRKYPFLQKDTELEIGSSTASSSKVFKLTVDDNGNIKTTNTSDSTEVQFAKTSDVPTEDHINELINNSVPTALSDLSDDETHRTVTDTEKEAWNAKSDFSGSWNDLTDKPNKPFRPDGESYLTFRSLSSFTLKVYNTSKYWDGTLEYFASDRTWTIWNGKSISSVVNDNGEYVLYLRGTGNTIITEAGQWTLTGSDIACIGNIENLLDYATVESGAHPTMSNNCYEGMFFGCTSLTKAPALPATTLTSNCYERMFFGCTSLTKAPSLPATKLAPYCYSYMFHGCTSLTKAPALPATTLASNCYERMFYNCTSLTKAPALPATTLASNCYESMFHGCTSLTQAPALPATTLPSYCYEDMFSGCTSLKLSSTQTGEYTQEYRIPSSGNGTSAGGALGGMFISTGGTFAGPPEINKTYYFSSDNIVVRETDIATLNGYVGSMINNAVPTVDSTLTQSGQAADAEVVGNRLSALSEEIAAIPSGKEQLTGTTGMLTPTQVYNAVSAGIPVKVQYFDETIGTLSYTSFNVAETMNIIAANTIAYFNGVYVLGELVGDKSSNTWGFMATTLAQKTDIPTALPNPNAITFTGAVTGTYNGSAPLSVKIPSTVTDAHINELIDAALNAIGVAEEGAY